MHSDQPHRPPGPSSDSSASSDPLDSSGPSEPPVASDAPGPPAPNSSVPALPAPRAPGDRAPASTSAPGALTLTNPTDIIATLPYLVGEPPDPGIVVLTIRGKGVHSAFCGDLDRLSGVTDPLARAVVPVDMAVSEGCAALVVVGYGTPEQVTPYVDALLASARKRGLTVVDALRVTGGRYWSYTCGKAECCPAEGTVVNIDSSTVPASAVLHGIVPAPPFHATMADIERIRAVLEPVHGAERVGMGTALEAAESRARRLLERGMQGALTDRGVSAALRAVRAERSGTGVTGREELAWLGVYLTETRVRDEVWARITAEAAPAHQELWGRVTRHLPERRRAAPASLLAVAAWQQGDEALAAAALDVALTADPDYSMAVLMSRALAWGLPVERWREFTPRWLTGRNGRPGPPGR